MSAPAPRTALVLGGGGARAAYQVGVLKALRELLPDTPARNPFPLICTLSGGAINGALLAAGAADFGQAVDRLLAFWGALTPAQVWRPTGRWRHWCSRGTAAALDGTPLRQALEAQIDFSAIAAAIENHRLLGLSIDCFGLNSAENVCFFQGRADLDPWRAEGRVAAHVRLGVDHVLAACALPLLFEPIPLHREYFADGAWGGADPGLAALELGAQRILRIGGAAVPLPGERRPQNLMPGFSARVGHVLERLYQEGKGSTNLATVVLTPSVDPVQLAAPHLAAMPSFSAWDSAADARLASYLLFGGDYGAALVDLGYRDALGRQEELRQFFLDSSVSA